MVVKEFEKGKNVVFDSNIHTKEKVAVGAKTSLAFVDINEAETYYRWLKKYHSIPDAIGLGKDYAEKLTLEDEIDYIQDLIDARNYSFTIYDNATGQIIGNYGIYSINKETNSAEIGGFIIDDYHNSGYGTEVVGLVADYAFKNLGVENVTATVYSFNTPSAKTLTKNGFSLAERKRKTFYHKGRDEYFDELIFSVSKQKFYERHKKYKDDELIK